MGNDPILSRRHALRLLGATAGLALAPGLLRPAPATAAGRPFVHGVATTDLAALHAFESAAGRYVRSFTYYRSLGGAVNLAWEATFAAGLVARGTTPVVTLQPCRTPGSVAQPAYAHERIVAGDHDDVLRGWARVLRACGGEAVVRFMHEGNGTWYPWGATVNGNTPASYVAAWRHAREVFDEAGATNVRWQWSMNKAYTGEPVPLAALYPGDEVVDQVGFSGYNGGTVVDRGGWRSFAGVFEESFRQARRLTAKPLYVAETSSASGSAGDRAAWITDMWSWLALHDEVAGCTWFDVRKPDVDWRLATSPEAVAAYRRGAIATVAPRT